MTDTARQWQATIKIGRKNPAFPPPSYSINEPAPAYVPEWIVDDSKTFYGDAFSSLQQSIKEWLSENKPAYFATETATCAHSDGTQLTDKPWIKPKPAGWFSYFQGDPVSLYGARPSSFESILEAFLARGIDTGEGY